MAKISLNPFKWLRREPEPRQSSPAVPTALLKSAAQPRKSGVLFMELIKLQKYLQSMELAIRQHIDTSWLVQTASKEIAAIRQEAEIIGEEDLGQAAGQLSAYFETVSEGRLLLTEEGTKLVREFVAIFKDAIGDAAPGVRTLDREKLGAWDSHYQALMAQMKPMSEVEDWGDDKNAGPHRVREGAREASVRPDSPHTNKTGDFESVLDEFVADEPDSYFPTDEHSSPTRQKLPIGSDEQGHSTAEDSLDSRSSGDQTEEVRVRDVMISDLERTSPRERVSLADATPNAALPKEKIQSRRSETPESNSEKPPPCTGEYEAVKAPVQLEEVERLKKKLLELHEEQETLSWRMSGILGGLKQAVMSEQTTKEEQAKPDGIDTQELEDIIFIGRKKG